MNGLTLKSALRLINLLTLVIVLIVIGVGVMGLRQVSNSANNMGLGKDVVADILPPPLFLIESQLTLIDLAQSTGKEREALLEKLAKLRKDYNDRNQYWVGLDFESGVKNALLGEQKKQGDLFWQEVDKSFMPALQTNNPAQIEAALKSTRALYEAHKVGVDNTVSVAGQFAESTLNDLNAASRNDTWIMAVVGGIGLVVLFFIMQALNKWLLSRLGGEPADVVAVVSRIAQGDLSGRLDVQRGDTGSIVFAMKQMQDNLNALVSEIQSLVAAAEKGDLSGRMQLADKQGFGQDISGALNRLLHVTDTSLQDIARVATALAAGDLNQKVEAEYPGAFGQTAAAVNRTVVALNTVVDEVRGVVDAAAAGDFSRQLDAKNKRGYEQTLAVLLNKLSETANEALSDISRVAQSLAEGDLTRKIERNYPGLFGETASGINSTVNNLQSLIGNVVGAVGAIGQATQEISAGNRDLSARTEQQASNLEETAASMEQFSSMVQQNTDNAKQANVLSQEASQIASRGGEVVHATVETMAQIQQSSKKVSDIISVIDGIAFQTNILALNAAVEAARAGEQGRGFAVVASEVRSLAQRSAGAAKEIATLISDSVSKVEKGTEQAREAGETMAQIVASIGKVNDIVGNISGASLEQSLGIQQVTQAVSQMDDVTQRNAALVEEASAAAESLAQQAADLQEQVSTFRLDHAPRAMTNASPVQAVPASMRVEPSFDTKPAPGDTPHTFGPDGEEDEWETF